MMEEIEISDEHMAWADLAATTFGTRKRGERGCVFRAFSRQFNVGRCAP